MQPAPSFCSQPRGSMLFQSASWQDQPVYRSVVCLERYSIYPGTPAGTLTLPLPPCQRSRDAPGWSITDIMLRIRIVFRTHFKVLCTDLQGLSTPGHSTSRTTMPGNSCNRRASPGTLIRHVWGRHSGTVPACCVLCAVLPVSTSPPALLALTFAQRHVSWRTVQQCPACLLACTSDPSHLLRSQAKRPPVDRQPRGATVPRSSSSWATMLWLGPKGEGV